MVMDKNPLSPDEEPKVLNMHPEGEAGIPPGGSFFDTPAQRDLVGGGRAKAKDSLPGKELSKTEELAGFLRERVGIAGMTIRTEADPRGQETIVFQVPDITKGDEGKSLLNFRDAEDVRAFYQKIVAAGGITLDAERGRTEGNVSPFSVNNEKPGFEELQDYRGYLLAEQIGLDEFGDLPAAQALRSVGLELISLIL